MSKVKITCTYVATADVGDIPNSTVQTALESDDGNFSIFEFADVSIETVQVEDTK